MRRLLALLPTLLLSLLTLICLPLFFASLILYPRSYWRADSFWANQFNHGHAAISTHGHLTLLDTRYHPTAPFTVPANVGWRMGFNPSYDPRPSFNDSSLPINNHYFAGFGYYAAGDHISHRHAFLIPFWFVLLATATPPLLLLRHLRRRRRRYRLAHNLCIKCAYDLRASPQKCPECGTPRLSSPSTFEVGR